MSSTEDSSTSSNNSTDNSSSVSIRSKSSKPVSSVSRLISLKVGKRKEGLIVYILLAFIIVNSFLFAWIFGIHKMCKKFAVLFKKKYFFAVITLKNF